MLATILCTLLGVGALVAGLAAGLVLLWGLGYITLKCTGFESGLNNVDYIMFGLMTLLAGVFLVLVVATLGHKVGCALLAWLGR